jgi:hypothetical protein
LIKLIKNYVFSLENGVIIPEKGAMVGQRIGMQNRQMHPTFSWKCFSCFGKRQSSFAVDAAR